MVYGGVKCYALLSVFGLCWLSNVLGHGLTMSGLFVALEESMWGVWNYYLNCIVPFADSRTDRIFVMSHCDLDIWRTNMKFTGLMHEALPIYKPSFAEIR